MDVIEALVKLREAMGVKQADLARVLEVSQANVSQLERRKDAQLSTLRKYVEALGGHLEIAAVFPDQTVTLGRAEDLGLTPGPREPQPA